MKFHPGLSWFLPHSGNNDGEVLGHTTGQIAPKSNFFCQENLTKSRILVENGDTYFLSTLMGTFGKLAGALALGAALTGPAVGQEKGTSPLVLAAAEGVTERVSDCVAFVKQQRALAADNGVVMSRKDQKLLLLDCQGGELDARIAEQRRVLAALDEQIRQLDLQLDEQGRILDEHGREIARVVAINGQLLIRVQEAGANIAALRADTAAKLREAERILNSLATSG